MDDEPFRIIRKELMLLAAVAAVLALEVIILTLVSHAEKIEEFVSYFTITLKLLASVFLWLNAIIIVLTIFFRRKKLIIQPWTIYLKEVLSFSITSSLLTIVFLSLACSLGVLAVLLLKRMINVPTVENFISSLRQWVNNNFY